MNPQHHDTVSPAPGKLELIRQFVNTYDAETDEESLASPKELGAWLRVHDLLAPGDQVRPRDLEYAIDVREALRSLLLANNGVPLDPDAVQALEEASHRARLRLSFQGGGAGELEATAPGVAGALGVLLTSAQAAMADGSWERLKVCPADDCLWAFYDRSRNRSRRWCEMEVCGNRAKVRSYRERSRSARSRA
jgi:predicted RNA-binding Zn ribbon-like protein